MFYKFTQLAVICSIVLCMCLGASAQTQLAQDHIDRYSLLEPFVPEGILIDRSPLSLFRQKNVFDPDLFNYSQQDTARTRTFIDYYRLFYHANYQQTWLGLSPDTLRPMAERFGYGQNYLAPWQQRIREVDVILGVMNLPHREIADDAFDSLYVYYDEDIDRYKLGLDSMRVIDTLQLDPNDPSSIMIIDTFIYFNNQETLARWSVARDFFMLASFDEVIFADPGQPISFRIPQKLYFGNYQGYTLQLDFGDGNGFQTVLPNQTYSITYAANATIFLKARLLNGDNHVVTHMPAVTRINVAFRRLGGPNNIIGGQNLPCDLNLDVPAGEAYAFIKYASANNNQLRKPFVLVEGFESSSYDKNDNNRVEASANGFGNLTWSNISAGYYGPGNEHMEPLTDFVDSLLKSGYDVVFVDFWTNHARIESNAIAFARILHELNVTLNVNNPGQTVELVGASMGGLISRVALREMERVNCCHNVRLFTTYASPHKGANIPLAIQSGLKDLGGRLNFLGIFNEEKEQYDYILNSPAARQMLIYHAETSALQEHQSLMSYLDAIGHPQETRKIAVSNGSLLGETQKVSEALQAAYIQPGDQMFFVSREVWAPNAFPLPVNMRSYRSAGVNGMFLLRTEGFVLPHSPALPSGQTYYKGGRPVWLNFADVSSNYVTYYKGAREVIRTAKAAIAAGAANPASAPAIYAAAAVRIAQKSLATHTLLSAKFNNNISANVSGSFVLNANFPTLGVDYAPGDFQSSEKEFNSGFLTKNLFHEQFTSVTTVSSIALNMDIMTNLSTITLEASDPFLFFEVITTGSGEWAQTNRKHVTVNLPIMNDLRLSQLTSVSSSIIHNRTLGNEIVVGLPSNAVRANQPLNADIEVYSWDIKTGGNLKFNGSDQLLYSFPVQGMNYANTTAPNSKLITKTIEYTCAPVLVNVEGGGAMTLGEVVQGDQRVAEVHFRTNSSLILHPSSVLTVNNGSTLIIEEGAELIVHPEAQIQLLGDSAILEIRGRVVLIDTARFSFSGTGFIRINQGSTQQLNALSPSWVFGSGARIELNGTGRSNKLVEVIGEWRLGQTNDRVKITNGRIYQRQNARMNFHGPVHLENVLITGNQQFRHNGLVVHGQPQMVLKNMEVNNANQGITAFLITYQSPLNLVQVHLNNNTQGLVTHGKAVNLNHCLGRMNGTFWHAYDIEGVSKVQHTRAAQNTTAYDIMGQDGARLEFIESSTDSNSLGVKSFGDLQLKAYCSAFNFNTTAIYAGNTQVLFGGQSRNRFLHNDVAIYVEDMQNLYLHNGYNDFTGSNWYLVGDFNGIAMNYLIPLPTMPVTYGISVANNKMPFVGQQLPMDLEDWDGVTVSPVDWTFMSTIPGYCLSVANAGFEDYILNNLYSVIEVPVNGQSVSLAQALGMAIQQVTKDDFNGIYYDLEALSLFNQIFEAVRDENLLALSRYEKIALEIGMDKMLEALSNAYRFGLLESARADNDFPVSAELGWVIDELNYRSDLGKALWLQDEEQLWMRKAHAYRTGEYYMQAREELGAIMASAPMSEDIYFQATYWDCVCELEAELIQEEIDAAMFEEMRKTCAQLLPEMRRPNRLWQPFRMDEAAVDQPRVSVYPNPSSDQAFLRQLADYGPARVEVFSAEGRLLQTLVWESAYTDLKLPADVLRPGQYFIKVFFQDGRTSQAKWSKVD